VFRVTELDREPQFVISVLDVFREIAKSDYNFVMSVRPFACLEQLGCYWTGFGEIWYLRIFRKSVKKIQVSLTSDKNVGYCRVLSGTVATVGYCRVLSGTVGYCRVLSGTVEYCRVLSNTVEYCRVLSSTVEYCGVLSSTVGYCRVHYT